MLKWKGLMSNVEDGMRRRLMSMLLLVCISMVVTQTSYIVVGQAHFIFVLAPVVAASLLFGTIPGATIGGITGLMVMIHARVAPFDVYERYFQSFITSVLLFAIIGFFMGIMFFLVERYRGDSELLACIAAVFQLLPGNCLYHQFLSRHSRALNDAYATLGADFVLRPVHSELCCDCDCFACYRQGARLA